MSMGGCQKKHTKSGAKHYGKQQLLITYKFGKVKQTPLSQRQQYNPPPVSSIKALSGTACEINTQALDLTGLD